jgi:hypothetical protein
MATVVECLGGPFDGEQVEVEDGRDGFVERVGGRLYIYRPVEVLTPVGPKFALQYEQCLELPQAE